MTKYKTNKKYKHGEFFISKKEIAEIIPNYRKWDGIKDSKKLIKYFSKKELFDIWRMLRA